VSLLYKQRQKGKENIILYMWYEQFKAGRMINS